jgi:hypothetical protein
MLNGTDIPAGLNCCTSVYVSLMRVDKTDGLCNDSCRNLAFRRPLPLPDVGVSFSSVFASRGHAIDRTTALSVPLCVSLPVVSNDAARPEIFSVTRVLQLADAFFRILIGTEEASQLPGSSFLEPTRQIKSNTFCLLFYTSSLSFTLSSASPEEEYDAAFNNLLACHDNMSCG